MNLCGEKRVFTRSKNNFSKVKWRFWGCKMITATGNRMPLLKTASHNTVSESVASLTFFFPSALSHTINFTSLSIPKSSSFHAKARLVTSFFACWVSSLLRSGFIFQHRKQATVALTQLHELYDTTRMSSKHNCVYFLKFFIQSLIKTSSGAVTFINASKPSWRYCVINIAFNEICSYILFRKIQSSLLLTRY